MIVGLVGHALSVEPTFIVLQVGGVVYGVHVDLHTSTSIQEGQEVRLHTTLVVKEDSQTLFGFLDLEARALFERLLKISGVGAKIALAILSVYGPQDFATLLAERDVKALQKVPGVGGKLGAKIIFDLEGYLFGQVQTPRNEEAVRALESLGFKSIEVLKVCASLPKELSTQEIIKQALQRLR
ncbi:Holliday junction branch migration protein RuvA [Helicobacter baculiformis]|uniref:Holliday junction branch migration complex subunit RuvA n=1 Tax=Helicobacter baculiformis TaxID=427351 RepID=A0A1M4NGT3_9HELI|nr:Holliday junction branch migration protein RuvA [Helicobacter baculiformis]SFZ71447.1 OMP1388 [Helicobacter baculiformis]